MTDKKVATFNGVARRGLSVKSGDKTLPAKLRAFQADKSPWGRKSLVCSKKQRQSRVTAAC